MPCIAEIKVKHNVYYFIVIYRLMRDKVLIADASRGLKILSLNKLSACFMKNINNRM